MGRHFVSFGYMLTLGCFLGLSLWPTRAQACASCSCGDPTLMVMGTERLFAGRTRTSVRTQLRTESEGIAGLNKESFSEWRTELALAIAPTPNWRIGLQVPMIRRTQETVSLRRQAATGLADIELSVRRTLHQTQNWVLQWQIASSIPSAPTARLADGSRAPAELQPGRGSLNPSTGVWVSYFAYPWSVHTSSRVVVPLESKFETDLGLAWLGTTVVQYQWTQALAVRTGLDARWSARNTTNAELETDSGGTLAFAQLGVVASLFTDGLLHLAARVPVIRALNGAQDAGWIWEGGITYDF